MLGPLVRKQSSSKWKLSICMGDISQECNYKVCHVDCRRRKNCIYLTASGHSVIDRLTLTFVSALLFSDFANSHNFVASPLFLKSKDKSLQLFSRRLRKAISASNTRYLLKIKGGLHLPHRQSAQLPQEAFLEAWHSRQTRMWETNI